MFPIFLCRYQNRRLPLFTHLLYEEYFQVLVQVIEKNKLRQQWTDKLNRQKEVIYRQIVKKGGESLDNDFMVKWLVDSLHVPLSTVVAMKDNHELSSGRAGPAPYEAERGDDLRSSRSDIDSIR